MLSIHCNSHIILWKNEEHPERITDIKFFINKYNWEGISYLSEKDDCKKFQENNLTTGLVCQNVFYAKNEKIYSA